MTEAKKNGSGRKSVSVLILYVVSLLFVLYGRAPFYQWTVFMQYIYATYVFGNVTTKTMKTLQHGNYIDSGMSRKLLSLIALFGTATALMFISGPEGEPLADFVDGARFAQGIFAIYVFGNVGDKTIIPFAERLDKKKIRNGKKRRRLLNEDRNEQRIVEEDDVEIRDN